MNKKILQASVFTITAVLFFFWTYLMTAFVQWNIHPSAWTSEARFFVSLFGSMMGTIIAAAASSAFKE